MVKISVVPDTILNEQHSALNWGCEIHRLHLCISAAWQKGKNPLQTRVQYDIKLSDGEAEVLEFWTTWSNPSLLLLPGPLWSEVVVPDRVPSMSQIELFNDLIVSK